MHRDRIASSVLRSVGYDPRRRRLEVEFASGRCYQYLDVRPEAYEALRAASSPGRHYNACIRDRYEAVDVPPVGARAGRGLNPPG
ncbi:KTSC domain-containing protein [Caldimonas thermodepolymerans]|jgi:hypothetical protein|uniref:KTSC domain-containing protein n=1 Tax=Caldimonas thermodepolymerans TaxID=215580 RepID=A0A2S5T2Z0_9BURK|nr:KTSC domain-containing protein [Caldimonas thermodepolymerans]PPE69353.1 KTSC domain-containing protein [Caldimonas thermodepolymerans]QPC31081.1 KTSC domain-containing protein [Caldimonas thermodepolymerans]RDH96191.1 KTSC domain-containing protein [Caldimonas thermodepolymerans]TCP04111.1 KTSC domain-containing protein [Caldimonas thermodepolymerans]UZG43805.1 KTSC domain-containing protein [Caldimonas thermodepolymerans]